MHLLTQLLLDFSIEIAVELLLFLWEQIVGNHIAHNVTFKLDLAFPCRFQGAIQNDQWKTPIGKENSRIL